MLIKIVGGNPVEYSVATLRRDNPNVSFPVDPPAELLAGYGVHEVVETQRPAHDPLVEHLSWAIDENSGQWERIWTVLQLPQADAAENIRLRRDKLLAGCDWVVTKAVEDGVRGNAPANIPSDWLTYRKALRDITAQPGFPFAVSWPVIPTVSP